MSGWVRTQTRMAEPYVDPDILVLSPPPVLFWRRDVTWRQDGRMYWGAYDPRRNWFGLYEFSEGKPDGMSDPLAREVLMTTPSLAPFRRWSIMPMAFVQRERCSVTVRYQDARYGEDPGTGRLGASATVPTGAPGCK